VNPLVAALEADHDLIWTLLDQITGGSDKTPTDHKQQHELMRQLVAVQSAHEFAEEAVVWPLVRQHCADGDEVVEQALQQECMLKRQLNELYHLKPGTEEFDEGVNSVAGENRTHLSYEQAQIWPRLDSSLSEADLSAATRSFTAARRAAPTRPHPHLPARPAVLNAVGPVLAARDRLADAVVNAVGAR
jgi:hemerythrin superfamily protein